MILKPLGPEVSIATANQVVTPTSTTGNNSVMYVRVINTGAAAVLHFANNGTEYANLTVSNAQFVVVRKGYNDTLTGANMLACPVAVSGV